MKMDITEDEGVVKVGLVGRLDTPGVDAIETRLTGAVCPRGARTVVDLSGVEFIGSLGLRMFITIASRWSSSSRRWSPTSSGTGPGATGGPPCPSRLSSGTIPSS